CVDIVERHTSTRLIKAGEFRLCVDISLVCRAARPVSGFRKVSAHAFALRIQVSQRKLGGGGTFLSRFPEPRGGSHVIAPDAFAEKVQSGKILLARVVPVLGRNAIPTRSFAQVHRNPATPLV